MTNLFSNDANYRGVARLWQDWCRLGPRHAISPEQLYRRNQEIHLAFDAWCMLLVVRACSQVALFPIDEDVDIAIVRGCVLRLTSGHRLEWLSDGTVKITQDEVTVVRFVPLPHVVEGGHEQSAVEGRISAIVRIAAANPSWTVILHPAVPGRTRHVDLAGVGDPPSPETVGAVDFVRVSPFSLESVERVARAVRWATNAPRMLAYPPSVTAPPIVVADAIGPWLKKTAPSSWALIRPLRSEERGKLAIDRHLKDERSKQIALAAERQSVDDKLRRLRGERREMADLNRRKRELLLPLQEAEDSVKRLEEFSMSMARAEGVMSAVMFCPVCRQPAEFNPRDNGCFAARCSSDGCGAIWELRSDPESAERVPVLLPGGVKPAAWPRNAPPQWVDDVLGCDVLAIPEIGADGSVVFRKPRITAANAVG